MLDFKFYGSSVAICFGCAETQLKENRMGRVKKAKPLWLQLKSKMSKETLRDLRKKLTEKEIDTALRFLVNITRKALPLYLQPAQKKNAKK